MKASFNTEYRTADFNRLVGRALDGCSRALDGANDIHFFRPDEVMESACVGHRTAYHIGDFEPVTVRAGFSFEERVWEAARNIALRAT